MKRLKNGKTAGDDGVVAELLKYGGKDVIEWIFELLTEIWRERKVPNDWKKSVLVPLHKKKDQTVCDNYRGISLLSVPGKVFCLVLLNRLEHIIDPQLQETQCGFRRGRGTIDQIWVTRQIVEKANEYQSPIHLCFVDLTKAYDSVNHRALLYVLNQYGVPVGLIEMIEDLYSGTKCCVRTCDGVSEEFPVACGVRQGCVLSPLLFNCFMDWIMREVVAESDGGLQVEYCVNGGVLMSYRDRTTLSMVIQNTQYADDLTLVAESRAGIQNMLNVLDSCCKKWGMKINSNKTKVMNVGSILENVTPICLNGQQIEDVDNFEYLGSILEPTACVDMEVDSRLQKAGTVYQMWRYKIFRSRNLSTATKVCVFQSLVMSVLLYGSETWPMSQQNIRKLKTFQMRCLRDILGFTLLNKKRNEDILKLSGQIPIEDELRKKRLQWFGHVQRMNDERTQKRVLRCRPVGKKRKPGAPHYGGWIPSVETCQGWAIGEM